MFKSIRFICLHDFVSCIIESYCPCHTRVLELDCNNLEEGGHGFQDPSNTLTTETEELTTEKTSRTVSILNSQSFLIKSYYWMLIPIWPHIFVNLWYGFSDQRKPLLLVVLLILLIFVPLTLMEFPPCLFQ